MTLRRCMWCGGCGWDSPPRPDRKRCRQCNGDGEVPDTHAWAGWEATLDFCAGGIRCPLPRRVDAL